VVRLDQHKSDRDRRSGALPITRACANIPLWNSEVRVVQRKMCFILPTSLCSGKCALFFLQVEFETKSFDAYMDLKAFLEQLFILGLKCDV
jgi:hypothetical protein